LGPQSVAQSHRRWAGERFWSFHLVSPYSARYFHLPVLGRLTGWLSYGKGRQHRNVTTATLKNTQIARTWSSFGTRFQDLSPYFSDLVFSCFSLFSHPWLSASSTSFLYRYRTFWSTDTASHLHRLDPHLYRSVSVGLRFHRLLSRPAAQRPPANGLAGVGSLLSVLVCNFGLDRIYIRLRSSPDAKGKPEYRLPLSILGALLLPFAVTAYGWVAQSRLPVPLLLASVSLLGFSLLLTIIPVSAYVVDACGIYSASAMTGVIVTRCHAGTFFPLTTGPLVESFGYGWGFTCLGGLSLSLAVVPMLILKFGASWRQRSKYTRDDNAL